MTPLDTDNTQTGPVIRPFTAGENLAFGEVCYFKAGDSKMWKADANATATMPVVSMCVSAAITAEASGNFLMIGEVYDDAWSWTVAGDIYASGTLGAMTQTKLLTPGDQHQILGWAVSANSMFFNPSPIVSNISTYVDADVTADTLWSGLIPANYMLKRVIIEETAGNAPTLSLGTTDGAYDVFTNVTFAASSITVIEVGELYSTSGATSLDLNDDQTSDSWNTATVDVTIILEKI